ncbi:hypothetical protein LR48_Vigan561s002800 [Vigna angularis]|uniref:Stress-response A/B barrel domain-containing protein n=2 Tax=Phaseolus angularis TaxID=3914 RepID=A0A0L9TDP0_PHAAN|nr:stress-response A/B barrel domain-containing protein HS1 [Vigna angularis]KAG2400139.1 Stress-response A/B barrel domain-containing protein [Vigna angularis]KOM28638.1 hypothetical protein LR48_Vigan561s002800 [Vigna angularis]BAT78328.1 hypothetical protein VIGAN_02099000 [Vigna angularis var. angularis]
MAEAKKEVRLVILAKFKEDATAEKIEEAITEYAKLVDVIPAMNSFHWGNDESEKVNLHLHEGYTHIFESSFDSIEGVQEYEDHPDHAVFEKLLLSCTEKLLAFTYQPITVNLHK